MCKLLHAHCNAYHLSVRSVYRMVSWIFQPASYHCNFLQDKYFGYIQCQDESGTPLEEKDIGDQEVTGLEVFDSKTKNKVDSFEHQDGDGDWSTAHIYFMITVKNPLPVPPSSTSGSGSDDSGSYSAPSSGYDDSGSCGAPSSKSNDGNLSNSSGGFNDGHYTTDDE